MAEFRKRRKTLPNQKEGFRDSVRDCGPGRHWVAGHRATNPSGYGQHWVKGHCADDSTENKTTRVEITKRYGWERGPVYMIEKKKVEEQRVDKRVGEDEGRKAGD